MDRFCEQYSKENEFLNLEWSRSSLQKPFKKHFGFAQNFNSIFTLSQYIDVKLYKIERNRLPKL